MSERETIEHCRQQYYDDMVDDYYGDDEDECDEDELPDGDDWDYWAKRMEADLATWGTLKK